MKRNSLFLAVLCAFSVAAAWAQSTRSALKANPKVVTPLVLYDNFNGRLINPAKWYDTAQSAQMREAVRDLSPSYQGEGNNRRLRIFQRAYSPADGNQDLTFGWLGLRFTNEAAITEVSFEVTVPAAEISPCQSNSSPGIVGAQFRGRFFNTGGPEGDVEAGITLDRDSTDPRAPLAVYGFYYVESGSPGDSVLLGFAPLGQTAKLRFKWDKPNHQFILQLNKDAEVSLVYNLADTYTPSVQYKAIQVTPGVPNCTITPPGSAMMDAYFDNVYVNSL
jgi:hypothetical protein